MPLTERDRQFLRTVEQLKIYIVLMAGAVLLFLLLSPPAQIQMPTTVIGIALCGVFWLTQRLLSLVTLLDHEFTRLMNALKYSLPENQQREFFSSS